jgi:16S rRNA U1498 N3-methylase RsmE
MQAVLNEMLSPKEQKEVIEESSHNVDAELEKIAKKHCSVETLETRKSDDKDFYDISVWCLKSALKAAYELGRREQA